MKSFSIQEYFHSRNKANSSEQLLIRKINDQFEIVAVGSPEQFNFDLLKAFGIESC